MIAPKKADQRSHARREGGVSLRFNSSLPMFAHHTLPFLSLPFQHPHHPFPFSPSHFLSWTFIWGPHQQPNQAGPLFLPMPLLESQRPSASLSPASRAPRAARRAPRAARRGPFGQPPLLAGSRGPRPAAARLGRELSPRAREAWTDPDARGVGWTNPKTPPRRGRLQGHPAKNPPAARDKMVFC